MSVEDFDDGAKLSAALHASLAVLAILGPESPRPGMTSLGLALHEMPSLQDCLYYVAVQSQAALDYFKQRRNLIECQYLDGIDAKDHVHVVFLSHAWP